MSKKRGTAPVELEGNPGKRVRLTSAATSRTTRPAQEHEGTSPKSDHAIHLAPNPSNPPTQPKEIPIKRDHAQNQQALKPPKRPNINKLAPPRPFPLVAASASATGPRSALKEGRNYICLTRKTSLSAYMRKCKSLLVDDGYKILHLHAMGAAIPLLLQLSCALPPILPFPKDEISTRISTGTVELQDEITPEDEDEDATYRTRGKSTLYVILSVGDPESEGNGSRQDTHGNLTKSGPSKSNRKKAVKIKETLVYEEPEQEDI